MAEMDEKKAPFKGMARKNRSSISNERKLPANREENKTKLKSTP